MENTINNTTVTENKYTVVFKPRVARRLIRMGNNVADIKPDKNNRNRTLFVFERTDKFLSDWVKAVEHNDSSDNTAEA